MADGLSPLQTRTSLLLGEAPLRSLSRRHVVVAGCGGVGGATALTLARLGIGRFTVCDPGEFDAIDTNRQWGAYRSTLGQNKAEVTARQIADVNPAAEVRAVPEGVTEGTVGALLAGADLVIDALDVSVPGSLRARLHAEAWDRGLTAILAPIVGFGAIVAVSTPGSRPLHEFGSVLHSVVGSGKLPQKLLETFAPAHLAALGRGLALGQVPSFPASPCLSAAISASEALFALTDASLPGWRPAHALPEVILIDLATLRLGLVDLKDLAAGP